jgi:hypothetical protein
MSILAITTAAIVSFLSMAFGHYLPLGHEPHVTVRYMIGTCGILVPATVLFLSAGLYMAAVAVWACAGGAGAATLLAYGYDALRSWRTRAQSAERRVDDNADQ